MAEPNLEAKTVEGIGFFFHLPTKALAVGKSKLSSSIPEPGNDAKSDPM
jgi:hypothetical protein